MKMQASKKNLWNMIAEAGLPSHRCIADTDEFIALGTLDGGTSFDIEIEAFRGRSVLIWTERQLAAALAMVELDGIARRIIICPPDFTLSNIPPVIAQAKADMIVSDGVWQVPDGSNGVRAGRCGLPIVHNGIHPDRGCETEWLLFTSGTSGTPKMVIHNLGTLTSALEDGRGINSEVIWSTFYDIRRFGGLQILLRAYLSGGSLVLSDPHEVVADFLERAGNSGVTHISGTPSHWRRALMSPSITKISPDYIRLSGEVADQPVLDSLRQTFPGAIISHAYASSEAGVAFDVQDGLAGFPASFIGNSRMKAELLVQGGSLRIRSRCTAAGYAGIDRILRDKEGFVDTGDMLELRNGRYYFVGRREGQINVGGLKVHPEEVEAAVNLHPSVHMSRVRGRASPITGAIVIADVVIKTSHDIERQSLDALKDEILENCRSVLPPYKVPAIVCVVSTLEIAASGKLIRHNA